jgi:hypothetical protein
LQEEARVRVQVRVLVRALALGYWPEPALGKDPSAWRQLFRDRSHRLRCRTLWGHLHLELPVRAPVWLPHILRWR